MIPVYKRVLLKISGEALAGLNGFGIDESVLSNIVSQIARVHDAGVEIVLLWVEVLLAENKGENG